MLVKNIGRKQIGPQVTKAFPWVLSARAYEELVIFQIAARRSQKVLVVV